MKKNILYNQQEWTVLDIKAVWNSFKTLSWIYSKNTTAFGSVLDLEEELKQHVQQIIKYNCISLNGWKKNTLNSISIIYMVRLAFSQVLTAY